LIFGFVGLVALIGIESITGNSSITSISMVLLAAMLYAYAVNMISKKMPGASGVALNGVAMGIAAIFFAPFAYAQWPTGAIPQNAIWSIIGLGVLCTALAFVIFFKVMADIGPARASLVTYINTAVAVVLGVIILSEPLTLGIMVGLPMVLVGSYFASRKPSITI
jgi:drug/metabolite transporter (DMT)-like permease